MREIETAGEEFREALEGLKKVHTSEELKTQQEKVNKAKEYLLSVSAEFRHEMEMKRIEAEARADAMKRDMEMRKMEIQMQMRTTRAKAEMLRMQSRRGGMAMMKRPKPTLKVELKPDDLLCPICRKSDKGNLVNGEPACVNCMHVLVKRSELKRYNRKYRRNWERRRRRKR